MRPRLLMVARGNNRNNGSNLGIAYLNANNALSNSNGNNWRSRPTFTPCAATRTGGRILDMFDAVLKSATGGLPIGYPFSHSLANLYLVPLYFLIRSIKGVSRAFCVFSAHPMKRLYLSLMSRKGWLMAINKHFSPVFKLPNGGYLWQAR